MKCPGSQSTLVAGFAFVVLTACGGSSFQETGGAAGSSGSGGTGATGNAPAGDSCTDGRKNGDESDVDCGGACGACASGADCSSASDCASGLCFDSGCSPGDAPLLGEGQFLTYQPTFADLPPNLRTVADQNWQTAMDRGMRIARTMHDWAELEPIEGVYDLSGLEAALDEFQSEGLKTFVTIPIVDSLDAVVPDDLKHPTDEGLLAEGLAYDDPEIVARFERLLDQVVPLLIEKDAFALSINNEPDAILEDSFDQHDALVRLSESARDHVRELDARLPVASTVTFGGLSMDNPLAVGLLEVSDILAVNWYCSSFEDSSVNPIEESIAELDSIVEVAGPRKVFFQELGCPSGFGDGTTSSLGASEAAQHDWFVAVLADLEGRPEVRGAAQFQMLDMAPEIWALYEDALGGLGFPPDTIAAIEESFVTLGMVRYSDGKPKPSWNAFLDALSAR